MQNGTMYKILKNKYEPNMCTKGALSSSHTITVKNVKIIIV